MKSINQSMAEGQSVQDLEHLVDHGRYLEACDLAAKIKSAAGVNLVRVAQLHALSLSKTGAPEAALRDLEPVYKTSPDDPETAGILGSIYKELFKKYQDSAYAVRSKDTYLKNFSTTRNSYTGINAATMSAIAGSTAKGREIATEVLGLLQHEGQLDFWTLATLGEAYLLTREKEKAAQCYARARQLAGSDWGKVISVHNQLWLLNHYTPVPKEILRIFNPPEVIAFIGHMIDHPQRTSPRFPAAIEDKVRDAIRGAIQTLQASVGYCALACGADILFAEAMEEAGAELHIVLPFDKQDFIDTSVRFAGERWVERFHRILQTHSPVFVSTEIYAGNDDLFNLQSKVIFGSAILHSHAFHHEPTLLTLLSETDLKRQQGGTRDTIRAWPASFKHTNINPDRLLTPFSSIDAGPVTIAPRTAATNRPVLFVAFADFSGANALERSKLRDAINKYASDGLAPNRHVSEDSSFVLVAHDGEAAAMDFVRNIKAMAEMIRANRAVSIGLHVGPVYLESISNHEKKILDCPTVELARTLAGYALPGSVCASHEFAAVLALSLKKFQLDYAGVMRLSEEDNNKPVYNVSVEL
jgi:tetratricopeptide (TPR) repeat protein/class 3 adenylate cyclase